MELKGPLAQHIKAIVQRKEYNLHQFLITNGFDQSSKIGTTTVIWN